jgi:hypothetical protein
MLASSRTDWMRRVCCTISRVSCLLVRVRSRTSWMGWGWHEAPPDQTMRQQVGNPGRIVGVALATGHGIGQDLLEPTFQDMPHGLPVDTCGLHRHIGAPGLLQPIRELNQAPCRRLLLLASDYQPKTGHHLLLMHVQTYSPSVQCLHRALL